MDGLYGVLVWVVIAAILVVVELSTYQFVGIWFAAGAVAAIIPAAFGAQLSTQLVVFLLSSVLFLFAIRPFVKKRINTEKQPTNADMVIGKTGITTEEIDNLRDRGRVSAMGLSWTARSETDDIIPEGAEVIAKRIEGVKLIVSPAAKN